MNKRAFFVCSFALTLACGKARAQAFAAIGSLAIPKSVSANGMGGISGSVLSDDPVAVMDNPGQPGAFSLNNFFSASAYTPKVDWGPDVPPSGLTLNSKAFTAGMEFGSHLNLPFKAGIGVGYSDYRISNVTFEEGSNDVTIALGIEYLVRFGLGYTFRSLKSTYIVTDPQNPSLPSVTYNAKLPAHNIGAIMEVPVVRIVSKLSNRSVQIGDGIRPMFDITVGASGRNIGGEVNYSNFNQKLPLPRQSVLGWSLCVGLETRMNEHVWELLTLTWASESSDELGTGTATSPETAPVFSFDGFEKGFGTIQPFQNLVLGKTNGQVTLGKGWEIDAADFFYLRG